MKTVIIIVLELLLFNFPALPGEADSSEMYFYVQLRASVLRSEMTFGELNADIEELECHDGYFRYLYGKYTTPKKAYDALAIIKKKGFEDAFVTNSQNIFAKKITINSGSIKASGKSANPSEYYTVQLSAMKFPIYLEEFVGVDDVTEYFCPDLVYRYCSGKFNSKEKASEYLSKLKNSGYKDAFIIPLEKYGQYRIE